MNTESILYFCGVASWEMRGYCRGKELVGTAAVKALLRKELHRS